MAFEARRVTLAIVFVNCICLICCNYSIVLGLLQYLIDWILAVLKLLLDAIMHTKLMWNNDPKNSSYFIYVAKDERY